MKKIIFCFLLLVLAYCLSPIASGYAYDLGKGVGLDAQIFGGVPYAVDINSAPAVNTLALNQRKDQYFVRGEIGVTYSIFRPFMYYENLTHDYAIKAVGMDVAAYSMRNATVGVRTIFGANQRIGVDNRTFGMTGMFVNFK